MRTLILLLVLPLSLYLQAQPAQYIPEDFATLLEQTGLELLYPLEGTYRALRPEENPVQPYQLSLWSADEKLEIRYFLRRLDADTPEAMAPHVETHRLAFHLANNGGSAISARGLTQKELEDEFNADWGAVYIFRPKLAFSDRRNCKMLCLYKEGKGMALSFLLFDHPNPLIDSRLYTLSFL